MSGDNCDGCNHPLSGHRQVRDGLNAECRKGGCAECSKAQLSQWNACRTRLLELSTSTMLSADSYAIKAALLCIEDLERQRADAIAGMRAVLNEAAIVRFALATAYESLDMPMNTLRLHMLRMDPLLPDCEPIKWVEVALMCLRSRAGMGEPVRVKA